MSDDRPYGYDDPDELRHEWDGPPITEAEFDAMIEHTSEPFDPRPETQWG